MTSDTPRTDAAWGSCCAEQQEGRKDDERYVVSAQLERDLAAANARAEANERDAERLNWLESNPRHAQVVISGVAMDCVFYGISCAKLVKLRTAIDAAIAASKEGDK